MTKFVTPVLEGDGSVWMMEVSAETAEGLRANGYRVEERQIE